MIIINGAEDQIIPAPPIQFYKERRWIAYTRAKAYARKKATHTKWRRTIQTSGQEETNSFRTSLNAS